ncbi:protein of unknown function [Hymenobacter daecheongensis DSM 21074]|uniref:DUF4258 domain-containing protein n=1 Tax=Hymenobacter daecheongensis DSM 21074 TaxID=1121955 RepID=A0A1M6G8S9_9BACT|nr:protein of unknown function [Hymenobacter daecheongensis DSM 21074]
MFNCRSVEVKAHAAQRMYERDISRAEVEFVLLNGQVIIEYLNDEPLPSFLLLAFPHGRPIHLLVGHDASTHHCALITVYQPDPKIWSDDFTKKLSSL